MGDRPFRVNPTTATNVNAGQKVTSPPKAEVFRHAVTEGEELYEAAVEENAPDREVGPGAPKEAGQSRGEGHLQKPDHPPAIPWPKVTVAHMPMRLK